MICHGSLSSAVCLAVAVLYVSAGFKLCTGLPLQSESLDQQFGVLGVEGGVDPCMNCDSYPRPFWIHDNRKYIFNTVSSVSLRTLAGFRRRRRSALRC